MGMMIGRALTEDRITQKRFASDVGITARHLNSILRGRHTTLLIRLDNWAAALGRRWSVALVRATTSDTYWAEQPPERVYEALMACFRELAQVEDVLAEGLGYERSEGGPDDPNGGGYLTGDHTALTLAMEARNVGQAAAIATLEALAKRAHWLKPDNSDGFVTATEVNNALRRAADEMREGSHRA
jgi:transcriptional regulator with XRE-family HTH domain